MSGNPSLPGATATRGRRWPKRLAAGVVVLLGLLALALALHERWLEPWLVRRASAYARDELGAELTVETLRLHLDGAELEGVHWQAAEGPLRRLDDARVRLVTDWRAELRGEAQRSWAIVASGIELALGGDGPTESSGTLPDIGRFELEASALSVAGLTPEPLVVERLTATGALEHGELVLDVLELASGMNRARIDGARATLLETPRATFDSLRGNLALELSELAAIPGLPLEDWPVESAELKLAVSEGQTSFSGRIGLSTGQLILERGVLRHLGQGSWRELECELALSADLRDLEPFSPWVGRPLAGRWSGAIEVSGPLSAPVGRFLGRGEELVLDGLVLDTAEIDLETDGQRVLLTTCRASGPAFRGHASGELSLRPLELVELTLAARADGPALATVLPFPAQRAFLATTLTGPPEALDGSFEVSLSGAELAGTALEDAEARGTFVDGRIHFDELTASGAGAELSASGSLAREDGGWAAELGRLELGWGDLACELERGATARFAPGRVDFERVVLISHSARGDGRAELDFEHVDGELRARLTCQAFDAGSVLSKTLPGGWVVGPTSGTLGFARGASGESFDFDLALDARRRSAEREELRVKVRGSSELGRLELVHLELEQEGVLRATGRMSMPFDSRTPLALSPGAVSAELELAARDLASVRALGLELPERGSGALTARLRLDGNWSSLQGDGELTFEDLALDAQGVHTVRGKLAFVLDETLRPLLQLEAREGRVLVTGALGIAGDLPALLEDPGLLLEAPMEMRADIALSQLERLAALVPELRRVSGRVDGVLTVAGTVQDPRFGGALAWREGELRLTNFATPFRSLSGDFRLEGDVVHIESLVGEVGGAPVRASGTIEPFGPFTRLDLRVAGQNLLLARSSRLRLRADADLELSGSPELLSVGGTLTLTEGLYESEFDILKEVLRAGRSSSRADGRPIAFARTGNLSRAVFDVHVISKRRFRYQTNVLTADFRPDAWLRGSGAAPTVAGSVYVDAAELVLPSGKLRLESGLLSFRPEKPFRPDVTLTAAMRVQRHDVRTVVTGDLDGLTIEPTSTPPLATDDLWVLILTGQLPTERWRDRSAAAMESLAVFLARDQFVRWFSGDSEGLLDRFELEVGARTTQSGQPTGRVLFYLKPRRADSRRATYLSAEVDQYEDVNYALGIVFRPR